MVFAGFDPSGSEFPDASTICRLRNRLITAGVNQKLLALINNQLEQLSLKMLGAWMIIYATIIPSAARLRQHIDGKQEQPRVIDSADTQAR